ncbi:LLM class flavin-dependent oxidoreductase [Isoptericola croceus]|uniref:LLM class flavin-dependent oxidoreductase n=1 Tax=Isoptericola croceus TaxID=3031406 RepID=UPI0023F81004|nr:LLM class flavin-dependent oxidoreductase [Isoptericola croceus]
MQFGLTFFPVFDPALRAPADYYDEVVQLAVRADRLGLEHVQVVEHQLSGYGGYSPDPVTLLTAIAARTERIRLTTGAVVAAFGHPIKLAASLALLDQLSRGRLDVGFGRAFLPAEFDAFGVPMDESRVRFAQNVETIVRLWTEEQVASDLPWAPFDPVTVYPRPFQAPHPPVFVASTTSLDSCMAAGRAGHHLQVVPTVTPRPQLQEMLAAYREARATAGHGPGRIQIKYTCYLADDRAVAHADGRRWEANYIEHMATAVSSWATRRSADYAGYEQLVDKIRGYDFDRALGNDTVLAGTAQDVADQLAHVREWYGEDLTVSLHLNPGLIGATKAQRALDLLVEEVAPRLDVAMPTAAEADPALTGPA